ncbi:response regulator transcription factor [Myroides odoratus]|uniref:response regulator transcription factor n=1 Tax=Myroides odoratus TaxID=256 RepID=UPI00333F98F2
MKQKIKIALIDDELLFLEGLILLLSNIDTLSIVSSANKGPQFVTNLKNLPPDTFPDLIMIDLQMEPMNGLELIEIVKETYPELKIIVLSSHYKQLMFGHMIKMGVSAFLPKNASKGLLLEAIEKVHETGIFLTKDDHHMLLNYVRDNPKNQKLGLSVSLSDREVEVVQLICREFTNQEISDQLFISKRTVESHRQRILEKIGAKNTVGIVIYAIAHAIYTPQTLF